MENVIPIQMGYKTIQATASAYKKFSKEGKKGYTPCEWEKERKKKYKEDCDCVHSCGECGKIESYDKDCPTCKGKKRITVERKVPDKRSKVTMWSKTTDEPRMNYVVAYS